MKKIFPLCLVLIFCAAAAPARALPARADVVDHVESCEAVLQEFESDPALAIPRQVLQSAHALVILNQFKAGLLFGIKGGYGIIMVKRPNGTWSVPALLDASELSAGLQIGAKSVETIYVITDDETPRLLFKERFTVGVDAKAVAGPHAAEVESNLHAKFAPLLAYTKAVGLYAGANLMAAIIERDDDADAVLYNTVHTMPELLYSDWVTPPAEVQPLMAYVQRLTR
jgi:lipid-binding SYLF domain-containing protein